MVGRAINVDPDLHFEIAWHMSVQISERGGTCRTNQVNHDQCLAFAFRHASGTEISALIWSLTALLDPMRTAMARHRQSSHIALRYAASTAPDRTCYSTTTTRSS
jgi:hypothetical protein